MSQCNAETYEAKSKELGIEFIETIGINGLSKVLLKHKIRRAVWIIIVAFGFIAFGVHLYSMLSQYWTYPVNTGDKLIENSFIFPDVTICTTEPFDKRKVTKQQLGIESATRFWDHLFRVWVEDNQVRSFYADKCADNSLLYHAKDRDIFLDLREHIHYCYYNGKKCNPEDFSIINLPDRLNCLTFHPKERNLNKAGRRAGLQLIFSKGPSFSFKTKYEEVLISRGFNLIIHENGTIPDKSGKSFFVETGKQTEIAMEMGKYEKLNTPNNPCRNEELEEVWTTDVERDPSTFQIYKRNPDTCRVVENQRLSIQDCQCWRDDEMIPWNNPSLNVNSRDYPLCHQLPDRYFYNEGIDSESQTLLYKGKNYSLNGTDNEEYAKIQKRAACFLKSTRATAKSGHILSCTHACTKLSYYTTKSEKDFIFNFNTFISMYYHFFNKLRIMPIDQKTYRNVSYFKEELDGGRNIAPIEIFADDLSVMVTSESLAYPLTAVISDFGGNLGLWIGISLISTFEIIDLIVRLIYTRIKYPSKKGASKEPGAETEMENLKA